MKRRRFLVPGLVLLVAAGGCSGPAEVSRIVFVTLDTTRADHLGCYGYADAETPNLDRLADEGVVFENAVSVVPTTLPSHATMFTGRLPQDHGVRYNIFYRLAPEEQTLAEQLREHGYATAGFPASQVVGRKFGLDQGFDTWEDPPTKPDPSSDHPLAGRERRAGDVVDLALDWLGTHRDARTFMWLHFYDPHWSYKPPFPYSARFRDRPYDGEIAYVDSQLGRFLEHLRQDPAWDRTLIVVAGDHGEGLYEHGERWHAILTYETTQHVPLIVRAPGMRGSRVSEPVGLVDLTPTVLDLAGVPAATPMRGQSLRPALEGRELPRREQYFETLAGSLVYGWSELHGIRDGRFKLIDSQDPELYDLEADPQEQVNLASLEPERVAELRRALAAIAPAADPAATEKPSQAVEIDPETKAMLASLGYVGGGDRSVAEGAPHPRTMIDLEPELLSAQGAVAAANWPYLEDLCRYTLKRDPTNKWALFHMPRALLELGRFEEGLEHARLAMRLYPKNEQGYAAAAFLLRAKKRLDEAHKTLLDGVQALPDSEALNYLAVVAAFDLGQADVCSEQVPRAVARHAKSGRMKVLRARCELRAGDRPAALATLRTAVDQGFRGLSLLMKGTEFGAVADSPEFAALLTQEQTTESGRRTPEHGDPIP